MVSNTNASFKSVTESSTRVAELVGEITAASNEQAQGIEQVNIAVAEMEKVTQQNAASSEESASASEELIAQAERMKVFVDELRSLTGNRNKPVKNDSSENKAILPELNRIPTHQPQAIKIKQPAARTAGAAKPTAEQVIPFDDEFDEFDEF